MTSSPPQLSGPDSCCKSGPQQHHCPSSESDLDSDRAEFNAISAPSATNGDAATCVNGAGDECGTLTGEIAANVAHEVSATSCQHPDVIRSPGVSPDVASEDRGDSQCVSVDEVVEGSSMAGRCEQNASDGRDLSQACAFVEDGVAVTSILQLVDQDDEDGEDDDVEQFCATTSSGLHSPVSSSCSSLLLPSAPLDAVSSDQQPHHLDHPSDPDHQHQSSSTSAEVQRMRGRLSQLSSELANRQQQLDNVRGQYERAAGERDAAVKDRDRAVLRFAERERRLTAVQRQLTDVEKTARQTTRERDMLTHKLSTLANDVTRLRQALDLKNGEVKSLARENVTRKDELQSRDIKIKWLQNKMTKESGVLKETQLRMDSLQKELRSALDSVDQLKQQQQQHTQDMLAQSQQMVEQGDSCQLTQSPINHQYNSTSTTNPPTNDNHSECCANVDLISRVECDRELSQLRHQMTSQHKQQLDSAELRLNQLQQQLTDKSGVVDELEASLSVCREELNDAITQRDLMSTQHSSMLQHTQQLTHTNVQLQVTVSSLNIQCESAEAELVSVRGQLEREYVRVSELTERIQQQQLSHSTDTQSLRDELRASGTQLQQLQVQYDQLDNNSSILKKRYQTALKEMSGELARLRQNRETITPSSSSTVTPSSSSVTSSTVTSITSSTVSSVVESAGSTAPVNGSAASVAQQLVEQLLRVRRQRQRLKQRLAELLEQNAQLVDEVRRKSRLLNSYLLREHTGAMSSHRMDQTKAEMVRMGGIMASLYDSQSHDSTMTLQLSLQINSKLQAVLEDTLLKNITLKDNLSILGQEIDKLTKENHHLKSLVPKCQSESASTNCINIDGSAVAITNGQIAIDRRDVIAANCESTIDVSAAASTKCQEIIDGSTAADTHCQEAIDDDVVVKTSCEETKDESVETETKWQEAIDGSAVAKPNSQETIDGATNVASQSS